MRYGILIAIFLPITAMSLDTYLCAYMTGGDERHLRYAVAEDGFLFDEVATNVVSASFDDRLVRDPHILKDASGDYHLCATVSWTNRAFTVWDSADLVRWENERLVDVAPPNATKTWAPEFVRDEERCDYLVYWTGEQNHDWSTAAIWCSRTKDFKEFSAPQVLYRDASGDGVLDANITKAGGKYRLIFRRHGVWMAESDSSEGPYTNVRKICDDNVEGPFLWKLGVGREELGVEEWALMFDYYGGSKGFGVMTTKDFEKWERVTNLKPPYYNSRVRFPKGIRHGCVLAISKDEAVRIKAAFGDFRECLSLNGEWAFEVTGGRRAGEKTTITVPSCWETQGFGTWQYGYNIEFGDKWHGHEKPADEHGLYLRKFTVPSEWRGKCIKLRFEGVMTEANVKVNGVAFPPHHSAWFPFELDVTDCVIYGGENTLEIDCGKESSDASVNRSERRCDFWNYGGIFRSVSLRAVPKLHIECVRIDARADGTLHAVVRASDGREETIDEKWTNIETWDVDHPKLYERVFELKDENGNVVDSVTKRFGFRTVEVRPRDGVYVNGKKIVVKGVNRQTFNARTGRTLTREMNYEDARLIKSLNMNAVRIAHLTADEAFLDACDELGLYVEDEFCSWQKPIRTELGREYLKVFLERDHNHPSVIFWSNGNEGGWNTELDAMFKEIDLQKRAVLHPWAYHDGIDTKHYPDYDRLVKKLRTGELFMPTEFQHGLYDGGLGAGLEDFWTTMMRYPNCVGGFLWALKDEAQWRDDLGKFDCAGNLAPDGLIGPNGEESGSCATVRAIFGECCQCGNVANTNVANGQLELNTGTGNTFTMATFPTPHLVAWRLKDKKYGPVDASFDWIATTNDDMSVTYEWTIQCTNWVDVLGVDFPITGIATKKWSGRGPDRLWRNRMKGPTWGVWEDKYNDAVPSLSWVRPFKGWFDAEWMEFRLSSGNTFTLCLDDNSSLLTPNSSLFIGVGTPKDGPDNFLYTMPEELGVGVYHVIPAIGNKIFPPERGGPQGKPVRIKDGTIKGKVTIR